MQKNQTYSYLDAHGVISFNMTNDYMFRYILQENKKVLKGIICSLLHLHPDQIKSIEITNPIDLSKDVMGKEFILDINVILNNNTRINLEMQVSNEYNWQDRSLAYLCRSFDQLYRGQNYSEALPVYHIGFLDFPLFPSFPEFYSTYKMMNVKNSNVYSSKFVLSVVDLSNIELATEGDRSHGIDYWARVFKARTWEELKMLAKDNEYLQEAANSIYMANADEIVRQKCLAREEAERMERTLKRDNQILTEENESLKGIIWGLKADNESLKADNASLQEDIVGLKESLESLQKIVKELQDKNRG